jgi:hypothetical protein
MCFDVRSFLGSKPAKKYGSPKLVEAKIPPAQSHSRKEGEEFIPSSSSGRLSRNHLSFISLRVPKDYYSIPINSTSSSLEMPFGNPVMVPPRTSSLRYRHKGRTRSALNVAGRSRNHTPITSTVTKTSPDATAAHFATEVTSLEEQMKQFQLHEIKILTQWYRAHIDGPYPTPTEREMLARQCGISTLEVSRWFSGLRKSTRSRRVSRVHGV